MKTKILSFITVVTVILSCLCTGFTAHTADNDSHISKVNGSFIQPWLYANWDDERWKSEMEALKEVGIDTLIMGDVANQNPDDTWTVFYPSELDFLQGYFAYDAVESIFKYCEMYDIKLYLGMGLDTGWNSDITTEEGLAANLEYMDKCNRITAELYNKYKEKYPDTYYGFYFVTELYNTIYMDTDYGTELYTDGLDEMFTAVIDGCNALNPDMPILFSPYINIFGYGFASINIDRFTEFWTQALTKIPFRDGDMICPQDSCGGGGNDVNHLALWTAAYRDAVDRANEQRGTKLLLGTNAEMFVQPDASRMSSPHGVNYSGTKTVDDFAFRLETAEPYVDSLFCFAYSHHYSPNNAVPGFHSAFVNYLNTGEIEKNPPTAPDTFCTEIVNSEGADRLKISFSGMTDDTDVGQINIYKDGKFYDYLVPGVNNNQVGLNHAQNVWIDYDFDITSDTAVYELEAVDVCGNAAVKSSYTVTPENVSNGVDIESHEPNMSPAVKWEKTSLDYLKYTVTEGGVRINGCDSDAVDIVIPDTIEGVPVTVIDWYAFQNCKYLKSVVIPETVTHISRFSFAHCISLESVNMPASLYSIEQYAFHDCPLLKNVQFPEGLAVIEERAFSHCSAITEITIPSSCGQIGDYAFLDCDSLTSITVKNDSITLGNRSLGFDYESGYTVEKNLTVYAASESTAETYCNENSITVKTEYVFGDVNADGSFTVADIVMLQKYLVGEGSVNDINCSDCDNNGKINVLDLALLKKYLYQLCSKFCG